jgi:very-short-patch-repair endonuclease
MSKAPRKKKPLSPAQVLRKAKAAANREKHTGTILMAAKAAGMPVEEREFRFHQERQWRFDFSWPTLKIAIEVNGGGGRGRHNTVVGATNDAEKMNAAQLLGWIVLVYTAKSIRNGVQIASDLIQAQIVRQGQ